VGVVGVGGDGLLVVEQERGLIAGVTGQGGGLAPAVAAVAGLADQDRGGRVVDDVHRQTDLVGIAVGAEAHPGVRGALVVAPIAWGPAGAGAEVGEGGGPAAPAIMGDR